MKKIYHLSTCSTCKRILKEIDADGYGVELQDIKTEPITESQLTEMASLSGNYEDLFSRRSRQYAAMGLKDKKLSEPDYKDLILKEYTFLKRPVAIIDGDIFIGNSPKEVERLKAKLAG